MNEERYILARFIQTLIAEDEKKMKEKGYNESWTFSEICAIIEKIRMEAVLGEPEGDLPWNEEEVE